MAVSVDDILESFWEWRLQNSPEFATMIGVHRHDAMLDDLSLSAYARRREDCVSFIRKLDDLAASTSGLSKGDLLNVKLLKSELQTFLDGSQHKSYLFPISNLEGPQCEFSRTVSWMKFENNQDYDKYFSRLEAFPKQISQVIDLLKEGVKEGYVMPRLTVAAIPEQLESVLSTNFTGNDPLYTPLKKFPDSFSEEERSLLKKKGIHLIEQTLKPAFKELLDYFSKEYLAAARDSIACSELPNGKAFYRQILKFHISCDMTPQQVHDLGLEEVKRIRARMQEVMSAVGFDGDLQKFFAFLRTDKQFYFDTKDDLMAGYRELCENKIKPKLAEYIKKLPKTGFRIVETPAQSASCAPAAYYLCPSGDGSRPGVMYVNTYKHDTRPKYEMIPLALHEAEPGHHLQTAFAIEHTSQPSFRKEIEDRKYYEAPARFAMHTAYMEGWGLYCEHLGEEMDLYADPYDLFGRLSMEMIRACRLVVDTGMHAIGWPRQKAVDFMAENTAMSLHNVNTEIDRYITWPGQACAYKVGEVKIKELRKKAESARGSKFDVRDFHHVFLLVGPMPLDTLEEAVDEYIKESLEQS